MTLKCPACGLTNFASATHCKKCKSPLSADTQNENIWRDGNCLVVNSQSFTLPSRCLKCNTSERLNKEVLDLNYYPSWNYLTLLPGLHSVHWTEYTIPGFLCIEHYRLGQDSPKNTMLPTLLIIFGVGALVLGVAAELHPTLLTLGSVLLAAGILLAKRVKESFRIKKRSKDLLWIAGVHPQFLDLLPKLK